MELLLTLLATVTGLFLYNNSKRKTAEALLENQKTKDELNKSSQELAKNNGLLEAEEEKRKALENAKEDTNSITDFFNRK